MEQNVDCIIHVDGIDILCDYQLFPRLFRYKISILYNTLFRITNIIMEKGNKKLIILIIEVNIYMYVLDMTICGILKIFCPKHAPQCDIYLNMVLRGYFILYF